MSKSEALSKLHVQSHKKYYWIHTIPMGVSFNFHCSKLKLDREGDTKRALAVPGVQHHVYISLQRR